MNNNKKKLIQLRTEFKCWKEMNKNITQILNSELEVEEWDLEVHFKLQKLEKELDDLKIEMNLSDEEWNQDESEE
jgi:hypothetical protein